MLNFISAVIKKAGLSLIWLMLCHGIAVADSAQEYAVKSAVALNLSRFTTWPTANGATLNLCVLGDQPMQQAFFLTVDKKPVGNKTLSVVKLSEASSLESCHILYIASQYSNKIKQLRTEAITRHILTMGEDESFLEHGGMIDLETVEDKINIQVNLAAVQQAKLQISSRVLGIVTVVSF